MKFIIILLFTTVFQVSLSAQWNTNTTINTSVCSALKSQGNIHSVTDEKGGIIMAWDDNRNSSTISGDIFAQRLNLLGIAKWTANGLVVCNNASFQGSSNIVDAGDGSAIVTWEDNRAGNYDVYAQKIDSSGNVLWTTNGVAVCSKTTNQKNPKIISDNLGGAILVWEDSVNSYWDVYAQKINATGVTQWTTGGVSICNAVLAQINPKIEVDGLGGAIITWQDKRNGTDYDIYAQSINNAGSVLWTNNGVLVCNAVNTQSNPRIEPDGSNGAIVAWVDKRNGIDNNIYAQRINSLGVTQWTSNGFAVCNAANNQSAIDLKYLGSTGALVTWKDDRVGTGSPAIYSQLVSLAGANQLTANGVLMSNALKSINPNTVNDGLGGAVVAWQDSSASGWNITSQRLNSIGATQWAVGGVVVSDATNDQINVSHVGDNKGGAIYAWEDDRNTTDWNIFAHHLFYNGASVVGINEYFKSAKINSTIFPNPVTAVSEIKLNAVSEKLMVYNELGTLVYTKNNINAESVFINNIDFNSGIYFYQITLKNSSQQLHGKFIITN